MLPMPTGYLVEFCLPALSLYSTYFLSVVFLFTPCALLVLCFCCGSSLLSLLSLPPFYDELESKLKVMRLCGSGPQPPFPAPGRLSLSAPSLLHVSP